MAVIYSTRLLAWSSSTTPPAYEVPAGYVVVMRDLDVWFGGGAIVNWQLSINDIAKIAAGQFNEDALAQTAEWRGRQVVQAGEFIVFASDGATDGALSGYLLLNS